MNDLVDEGILMSDNIEEENVDTETVLTVDDMFDLPPAECFKNFCICNVGTYFSWWWREIQEYIDTSGGK